MLQLRVIFTVVELPSNEIRVRKVLWGSVSVFGHGDYDWNINIPLKFFLNAYKSNMLVAAGSKWTTMLWTICFRLKEKKWYFNKWQLMWGLRFIPFHKREMSRSLEKEITLLLSHPESLQWEFLHCKDCIQLHFSLFLLPIRPNTTTRYYWITMTVQDTEGTTSHLAC